MNPGATWLYIARGENEQVLYVGIARRWGQRWEQHAERSEFFLHVRRLDLHPFETRGEAEAAERAAILEHRPPWNERQGIRPRARTRHRNLLGQLLASLFGPRGSGVADIEYYCDETWCMVREVEITAKHYPEDAPADNPLICPACYRPLKFHRVLKPHRAIRLDGSEVDPADQIWPLGEFMSLRWYRPD